MRKRVILALLALFCAVGMIFAVPVMAAVGEVSMPNSDLTLHYYIKNQLRPMEGVTFYVYKVGNYVSGPDNGVYTYELTRKFADSHVDVSHVQFASASAMQSMLEVLLPYSELYGTYDEERDEWVKDKAIPPTDSGETDENGYVIFENLSPGLYMVCGQDKEITEPDGKGGERTWTFRPQPFLIPMPYPQEDGGFGDVTAEIKYEQFPPDFARDIDLTVKKVWETASGDHPDSITVVLLRNGEYADKVTLSAENNWEHTWTGLDASIRWEVWEKDVPDGYTVTVDRDGYYFVINNKPDEPPPGTTPPGTTPPGTTPPGTTPPVTTPPVTTPPVTTPPVTTPPGSPPPSEPPGLPQTGQLWWPVPLLVAAGVLLLLIGAMLFVHREDPEEALEMLEILETLEKFEKPERSEEHKKPHD